MRACSGTDRLHLESHYEDGIASGIAQLRDVRLLLEAAGSCLRGHLYHSQCRLSTKQAV